MRIPASAIRVNKNFAGVFDEVVRANALVTNRSKDILYFTGKGRNPAIKVEPVRHNKAVLIKQMNVKLFRSNSRFNFYRTL